MIGKIVAVSDLTISVLLDENALVHIKDIVIANYRDREYKFEIEEINGIYAKALALDDVMYLKKGIPLYKTDGILSIEYSDQILGKVFDSYGKVISNDQLNSINKKNVYDRSVSLDEINIKIDILYTGIKVIDFFAPIQKGAKLGLLGGAGVGKTVLIKELMKNSILVSNKN